MKKLLGIAVAVGIIAALSIGVYAHGGGRSNTGRGGYGGHMMGGYGSGSMMNESGGHMMGGWNGGHMMGGGYGPGSMMGNQGTQDGQWDCDGSGTGPRGWNVPGQSGTAQEALTDDQLKESVQTYVDQYLPGYTIETIEQDQWRPMSYATLKGENGAELQLSIHNFSGQVMHVFGVPAEDAPTE